ncbi:MAG TPA: DUF4062 domain-containing protein [Hyphomonadaceae bacterium]|jgi:hypothetical protein|nr:DUF4062 domain-containing protein [Hyphomonadaceae bacterium]
MKKLYHVFVSSTYSDLADERKRVSDSIARAGYVPEGMEIFPASSQKQMDFIKSVIDRCDYYILIVGGMYGSIWVDETSYTRAELDYALSRGIPVLAFVHKEPSALAAKKVESDPKRKALLDAFREYVLNLGMVDLWSTSDELGSKALAALAQETNRNPRPGWLRADTVAGEDIYRELDDLRKQNARLEADLKNAMQGVEKQKEAMLPVTADRKYTVRYTRANGLSVLAGVGPYSAAIAISPREVVTRIGMKYESWASLQPLMNDLVNKASPYAKSTTFAEQMMLNNEDVSVLALAMTHLKLWEKSDKGYRLAELGREIVLDARGSKSN